MTLNLESCLNSYFYIFEYFQLYRGFGVLGFWGFAAGEDLGPISSCLGGSLSPRVRGSKVRGAELVCSSVSFVALK